MNKPKKFSGVTSNLSLSFEGLFTGDKSNKFNGINFSSSSNELILVWDVLVDETSETWDSKLLIGKSFSVQKFSSSINKV